MGEYRIVPADVSLVQSAGAVTVIPTARAESLNGNGNRKSTTYTMVSTVNVVDEKFGSTQVAPECRVYRKRWIVLFLFVFYSMSNAMQWVQYAIIANVINDYYNVSFFFINWTSMIYMVTYIPFIFPAAWLLDKAGLRVVVLLGSLGTAIGSWIKVFSVSPDLFLVSFAGQTIVAISQIFVLSIPPRLAAVWFGPDQISTACAVGVFGNQLGVAMGFVLPPMIVSSNYNSTTAEYVEDITGDLKIMFYSIAGFTTVLFVLIIFLFSASPPLPPSQAQAAQRSADPESYSSSIIRLVKNKNYILLLITYGINTGVFYAISTLLNQVILEHFPGHEQDAGRIGLMITVSGMLGSVVSGFILDKTHKYKETTLTIYALSLVGMLVYAFTVGTSSYIAVVYVTASFLGFFMTGYLPVGFEFAAELTYPEPEGTSSGLLNASAQVFGILFTMAASLLLKEYGDLTSNLALACTLLIGTAVTAVIKSDLRRQAAQGKTFEDA